MNEALLLEIGTILSIVAIALPVMAACGMFKSRRHRELDAKLKRVLREGSAAGASMPLQTTRYPESQQPAAAAVAIAPATVSMAADAYDLGLRSRAKSFDSGHGAPEGIDLHSAGRIQRRYRRTRCVLRNPSKGACPKCGYLL